MMKQYGYIGCMLALACSMPLVRPDTEIVHLITLNNQLKRIEQDIEAHPAPKIVTIEYHAPFKNMDALVERVKTRTTELKKYTFDPQQNESFNNIINASTSPDSLFNQYKKFITIPIPGWDALSLQDIITDKTLQNLTEEDQARAKNLHTALTNLWPAIEAWKYQSYIVDKPKYYSDPKSKTLEELQQELERTVDGFKKDSETAGVKFTKSQGFADKQALLQLYAQRITIISTDERTGKKQEAPLKTFEITPGSTETAKMKASDIVALTNIATLIDTLWKYLATFNESTHFIYPQKYRSTEAEDFEKDILPRVKDRLMWLQKQDNSYKRLAEYPIDLISKCKTLEELVTALLHDKIAIKKGSDKDRYDLPKITAAYLTKNTKEYNSLSPKNKEQADILYALLTNILQALEAHRQRFWLTGSSSESKYNLLKFLQDRHYILKEDKTATKQDLETRYWAKLRARPLDSAKEDDEQYIKIVTPDNLDSIKATVSPDDQSYIEQYKKALDTYINEIIEKQEQAKAI